LGGPKNLGGDKMFAFRRITLFCLEKHLLKHKMTIFSKNLVGGMAPLTPLATPMTMSHHFVAHPGVSSVARPKCLKGQIF